MLTHDDYKKIAENCSSYNTKSDCKCLNSTNTPDVSCTTCKHFTNEQRCNLNLIDPIVENHNI